MKHLPRIGDHMDAVVPTLSPETRIMKAVDFLLRHRVTGAPVVDSYGRLLGIITETDLLKLVTEGIQGQVTGNLLQNTFGFILTSEPDGENTKGKKYQLNGNMGSAHNARYVSENKRSVQSAQEKNH